MNTIKTPNSLKLVFFFFRRQQVNRAIEQGLPHPWWSTLIQTIYWGISVQICPLSSWESDYWSSCWCPKPAFSSRIHIFLRICRDLATTRTHCQSDYFGELFPNRVCHQLSSSHLVAGDLACLVSIIADLHFAVGCETAETLIVIVIQLTRC